MVPLALAFGGVPGGPELVIVLIIAVLLFGVPLVLVGGAVLYLTTRSDDGSEAGASGAGGPDAERIAELEAEVERLREKVDDGAHEEEGERA
ncbi:preprotein translocase subunit TatA [Halorubrum sp. SD612]|uniref:preprotein translocase subunit TatA n=1 Tax=Halorubrum sp. SD612 TaxID=1855863 RepID=UPI000A2D6AA1|nr:preprotein translocase subunit TatA [Halorubrum sp. SD612]OTF04050.1 preprotein translocase subunit TatA [Halorubrum sp. SD612]